MTAVDPASGQVAWRFDPGMRVTVAARGAAGLAVATYVKGGCLYLLDATTGRPRWRAAAAVALGTVLLMTRADVIAVEGGVAGFPKLQLVSRDAANGAPRWSRVLPGAPAGPQPVVHAGTNVVVQTTSPRAGQAKRVPPRTRRAVTPAHRRK